MLIIGISKPVAQVVVRRSLLSGTISSANLIRLGGIVAGDCAVHEEQNEPEADAKRLQALAEALPVAIRTTGMEDSLPRSGGLGDAAEEEQQASVEARCATDTCGNVLVNQLEVRVGMTPAEFARLQQYRRCEDLADAVRAITGCVEGPICSNSETTPCEFSMCFETTLNEEQSLRLMSLLQSKGVAVSMIPVSPSQE